MELRLTNTRQRRHQTVSFSSEVTEDPSPPEQRPAMFQEHYRLEGTVVCTFWANTAQLDGAKSQAEKTLRRYLYSDVYAVLSDIELAVEEMDQEQLRKACLDMRDALSGKQS